MNENATTIDIQIQAKAHEMNQTLSKLVTMLTGVQKSVSSIENTLNKGTIKTTVTNINNLKSSTDKATNSASKLGKALSLGGAYIGAKRLTQQMLSWMNESIDFTEQLNLFNVVFKNVEKDGVKTFSTLGKEATKFQYKLNEAFGTNKTQTLYMQGIFQSMGENVGIDSSTSAIMSETMTKLTYDLASLYNKSEKNVAEALRAGVYAGQTKPLRSYGIDVTQTSMQPILDSLGINDRSVKQMSQAEKELLRYIATLKQSQIAMGDMANTIESPSNQTKIFTQQLIEAKIALTSLFMGTFANILPYANAFLMVVKEVSTAIATMFGIELTDYNSGIASQADAYEGLEEDIDGATKAVKELKRQTLGFDQINNISENKDSGLGTNDTGGIDKRLLDAIKGYDNGMENVKMKATEIRDSVMEWLGFTKEVDSETGKVSFKLKDGYSNLKLIGGIIATIVGFKLVSGIVGLVTGTTKLGKLLGTGGLYTTLKKIIDPIKVLGAKDGLQYIFLNAKSALSKFLPIAGKVSIGIGGIAGVIFGSKGAYNGMKNLTVSSENTTKNLGKMALGLGEATAGGALLGSVIPGVGTLIGGLGGAIVGLTASLIGYNSGIKELAYNEVFGTLSVSTEQWTEMLNNLGISINDNTGRFATLQSDLSSLNSSFESSADKLDFYGLKFGKMSQKISDEDAVNIKNAINDMCESSNNIIDKNTTYGLKLVESTFKQGTKITNDEQKKMLNSILNYGNKQKTELKTAQDSITTTYDNAIKTRGYLTDEEYKYIAEQLNKIRELTNKEMSVAQTDIEYYKALFADKNQKLDEQSYKNYKEALDEFNKEKLKSIQETYNQELNFANNALENGKWSQEEYDEYLKNIYSNRNNAITSLNQSLQLNQDKILLDLRTKYKNLLNDNTDFGKNQKSIIEGIFKNLNIDIGYINGKFYEAGEYAGKSFGNGFGGAVSWGGGGGGAGGGGGRFANGGSYHNGSWHSIQQYANGGSPSHGTMFVGGEAGPEIIGHINGRTEILNQSQLASVMFNAVVTGMSQAMSQNGQASQIDIRVHSDGSVVVDEINQKTKQTGICPINIPT